MKNQKTNAMRLLDNAGIPYEAVYYDLEGESFSGAAVCRLTGIPEAQSFKTLCTGGDKNDIAVFVVPVSSELDLKKAARAAGRKKIDMLPQKRLLAAVGYNRGEVSPIGMKKPYPTFIDQSALEYDRIACSAGRKGTSLLANPNALAEFLGAQFCDLTAQ